MITFRNILDNQNFAATAQKGPFTVYEHLRDLSTDASNVASAFFMYQMSVRRSQLLCVLDGDNSIRTQAGAMQWVSGPVECDTGLGSGAKAIGNFLKGAIKGAVTGEKAVKPVYKGTGHVMLEPTYKHILLEEVSEWGPEGIVIDDGLFLAADGALQEKVVARKNLSSVLGGEGLFNLTFSGAGVLALESYSPREELFEFNLENDVLKIDGNMAIAWSGSLEFTCERSSKSLIGSMVNGEGLVNVYRGTGRVLMAPTVPGTTMKGGSAKEAESGGAKGNSGVKGILDAVTKL